MERIDTGILDTNCKHIFTGDKVKLFNQIGECCILAGAYGIVFSPLNNRIDW